MPEDTRWHLFGGHKSLSHRAYPQFQSKGDISYT